MDNGSWVEAGIINTFPDWLDNQQRTNPVGAYSFFWADGQKGCQVVYYDIHTITNTVPNGTAHSFFIACIGNKKWNIYFDNNQVGTSTITESTHAVSYQVGLEYANQGGTECNNNGAFADQFVIAPYYYNGSERVQWTTPDFLPSGITMREKWYYDVPYGLLVSKNLC